MKKAVIILFFFFACTAFQQAVSQTTISIALQNGSSNNICSNSVSVSFEATVTNCSNPTYQWYINNTAISNQTGAQLSYNNFSNGDVVTCKQTNNNAPCVEATSNGITINIKPDQAISWINSSGNVNQTMCQYITITPIKFQVIGATGATVNGLPTGLSGSYNNGEFTISGAPTQNGTFNYQVSTSGSNLCGSSVQTGGTITVKNGTVSSLSPSGQTTSIIFNGLNYFVRCINATSANISISNSTQNTGSVSLYKISWGDNSPDTTFSNFNSTIIHNYNRGFYQLTFTTTTSENCVSSATYGIFIGNSPKGTLGNLGNLSGCGPMSITFPISDTTGNVPGTTYHVEFGDGKDTTFVHPNVPTSVVHIYDQSSCGFNLSSSSPNTFTAQMTVSNPCFPFAKSTIGPIVLSLSPEPKIVVSKNITCIGDIVQVIDTSKKGVSITASGCATNSSRYWTLNTNSGFSTNNSLGNNGNHPNDIDYWTNGDGILNLNFTQSGTYIINLFNANSCNPNNPKTTSSTICVNPTPLASFTIPKDTLCAGESLTFSNTSNTPLCGNNVYTWSVSYTSTAGCSSAVAPTYVSNTGTNSENPVLNFSKPGVYEVSLKTSINGTNCSSVLYKKTIVVKDKPNVALNITRQNLCLGDTLKPTITTSCYTTNATYNWSFPNATPASASTLNPGTISFNSSSANSINVDVTNTCGTTNLSKSITVYNPPTLTVPANKTVCAGSSTGNLSFTSNGSSITWTNSNTAIGLAASGSGNTINAFTAANNTSSSIVTKIVVTATNTNCSKKDSFNITINPKPAKPAVTRPISYCINDAALALSATPLANHTLTWYTLNTLVGGSATAITPSISTAGTTNYFVTQTNTYNCPSDSATIPVTVTPAITNNTIKTDQTLCGTSSPATITSDAIISGGNGTYTYQWQQFNGSSWVNIVSATSASYAPGSVSATTKYRRLVTSSSCNSISNEVTVTVIPVLSNTNITGLTQTICEGTSPIILDGQNASGGSGTYSYTWESSPDNSNWSVISGANSEDYQPPSLSATSYYRRKISSGVCFATSSVVTITVNPKPLATIAVASTICDYNIANATFTSTKGTGPFNVEVTVTKPSSGGDSLVTKTNINSGASISVIAANSTVGNYSIVLTKITDSKGCVTTNTAPSINVSIISKPSLTISQAVDICSGGNASLTVSGATTYSWSPSATLSSSSASTVTATPTTTTTYTVKGTTSGCDNTASVIVTVNPKPVIPDQSVNICSNSSFTNNPVNGGTSIVPTGTTYTWSLPVSSPLGAITGGSAQSVGQASISQTLTNNTTSDATLTYTVTPTAGNCTGASFKVVVTVKPQPGISDQNIAICSGTAFSATPIGAPTNTTYTWANDPVSNPIGAITGGTKQTTGIATIGQTLTNTTNAPAVLTYTVTPSSGGCGNGSFTVAVTVNPKPAVTRQTTAVCSGTAFTVTPTNVPSGTTYSWVSPVISPANAITGGVAQSVGQTSISQTLTNTTNTNATATYNVVPTSGAGGSCAGSAFEVVVTVNPKPNISSYTVSSCSGTAFTSTPVNGNGNIVPSGTTYTWALPTVPSELTGAATGTSLSAIGGTLINTSNASKTAIYTVTPTSGANGNCIGADFTVTVTVNPKPSITNQSITVCSGEAISFLAIDGIPTATTIVPSGTTYSWAVPTLPTGLTGAVLGNNASSFTNTLTNNTNTPKTVTYPITPKAGTCDGQTFTITVIVNPKPVIANQKQIVCSGTPFTQQLVDASPTTIIPTATTYTWAVPTVTGGITGGIAGNNETSIGGTLINTDNVAQTATYTITPTSGASGNCVGSAFDVIIKVNPIPNITAIGNDPDSCGKPSGSITITGLVTDSIYTVNYTFGSVVNTLQNQKAVNGTIVIPKLASGSYTSISVSLNNCQSNIIGSVSLKDPKSPDKPILTASNAVCSGVSLTLSINNPDNSLKYIWSGQGGISDTGKTITILKTIMANNGIVSVTATKNSCTSDAGTIVIKIDSTPVAPTVTTPITICSGNTINLTTSTVSVGAGSINYVWAGPNSFSNANQNTSITNAPTTATGTYSVTATATNGNCVSAASNVLVTVNPTPIISDTSSSNPDKCATTTGSFTFKTNVANKTFTVYYNDGSAKTKDVSSDANGYIKIDNLLAGTYSNINVKTIPEGCTSNTVGPFTLTDPTPPATPVISGDSVLCSGKNLSLNSLAVNDATYKWLAPDGTTIATTQNLQLAAITTGQSGLYKLIVTVSNCTSGAGFKNVVIDSTPAIPTVSSNTPLCSGSDLALKANTVSAGNMVYAWIGPNGFTNNAANPTLPNVTETASGTYKVSATATVSNCVSDTAILAVIVRPALTKATISGLDSLFICGFAPPANASLQLTGNIDASRAFEKGRWSIIGQPLGGNGVFTYDTTASTNFAYAKSGLYNIAFTITNDINCPATKDTVVLSIIDKPAITNELKATATSICAGNPVTIQVPLSAISGQIKYWQFKRPASAANWQDTLVTNPSITFNNVQDTFSVRLVVISTDQLHCSGDTAFKEILINAAPPSLPGISAGEDSVCQSANSGSISLTGNIGLPVSWQLSTDGTNFSNIAGTATQNYTYTNLTVSTWFRAAVKSGACDTVFSNATKITVYPPVKAAIAGSDAELCGDSTYQLSGNQPSGYETGLWSFAAGSPTASFNDATKANTTLRNMQPNNNYQLLWTLSNGICPSTFSKIIIKNYLPLTNTIDSASITVCNSATVTATGVVAVGGNEPYLYQWQSLKGNVWVNIIGANNPSYSFTADTTVKLRRLVTATPCTNISLEKTVYVQPPLANNTIAGATETCINTSPGMLTGSLPTGGDGNYLYQWQILQGSNWTDIVGATQKNYTVPVLIVNTTYRRLVSSALCSGNRGLYSSQFDITVRPDAEAKWTITKDTACAPFVIDNAIVTPTLIATKNVNYSWYANGTNYGNSATINPSYTLTKAGDSITLKMVANSLYGCKNDSLSHVFFTIPPVLTNFTVSDTAGCGPLKVTFTNTTPYLGFFTYQWNFGNNQASTQAQPVSITYTSNPNFGDTTYLISLTATSECESVIKTRTVTVASRPKSIFTPSKTTGCSPMTVSFTNLSKGIGVTYLWDFGDGNVLAASNKQSVSHVFTSAVQDTFLVKLIAMNQCGNDTSTYNIVVSPNQIRLDLAVNGNQKQVCKPATVSFINASSGATSFNWNFGDGNVVSTTKNLDTVSHTFLQAGNYTVTLFATNGCSDTTTTELIQVFNAPSANFNAVPTTVCLGDTIRFTNQSDTITSLLWNFKDGYTSTVINPTHAYKVAGIYNVQLTAIRQYNSGLACTDSITKPITVLSTLPGAMKVSDSISSCVPFTTTFTNLSLPSAITIWQYGNGVADTGNVVTYTYTKVGNYTVNMLATNSGGCKFAATANIQVNGPEGIWQHDKGFVCGATPVRYEVFATGTDSVRWDFGDGISVTTSGKIIYHTYTKSGLYLPTATLISSSLKACTVTLKAIDTVKVDYVSAGFRIADNKICGNTTVTFTDTSRSYFPIANYSWSFGNGNTAITPIATQQYTTTNTWQTDLAITSASGCSSSISKNSFVKVNNYPKVTIQTLPIACINKPTNYFANVTSNDSINLYSWQFSNGVNLNGQSVNNLYNTVGTYTAKVLVSTIYGCADSTTLTHTLNPTPNVIASVDQLICRGKSVPLSVTGAATYSWVPLNSNLSCYTCTNPIAAPTTTTNYIVTGFNSVGCSDDDTVLITVAQPIKLTVSPNDTICIGQSSQLSVSGGTSYVWSPSIGLNNTTSATPLATPTLTTKYQVIGFDNHNCFQDTAYVEVAVGQYPTIQLAADQVLATGTLLPLNYTSTNGPLTSWKWTPATNLSCNNCAVPIATIKKDVCYTVVATNIYKCAAIDTICIKVFCENTQVFIPNVFTPDNDGVNDVLMVRGTGIKTVKSFRIYNRWGQIVFERGNITPNNASQGWDGKINGTPASPDVYVYTCEVVCENDVTFTYKGNVAIIK